MSGNTRFSTAPYAGHESSRVSDIAKEFGIHERQVVLALEYAAANRDKVEARIIANDQALLEAERIGGERRRVAWVRFLIDSMFPSQVVQILVAAGTMDVPAESQRSQTFAATNRINSWAGSRQLPHRPPAA